MINPKNWFDRRQTSGGAEALTLIKDIATANPIDDDSDEHGMSAETMRDKARAFLDKHDLW